MLRMFHNNLKEGYRKSRGQRFVRTVSKMTGNIAENHIYYPFSDFVSFP